MKAYKSQHVNPSGKRGITFVRKEAYTDLQIELPCGQCVGCRLERSRQWAIRCMHEAHMHDENTFLTLTYDDDHLPEDGSLDVRHFQNFMKRLRQKYAGKLIRFYHCGEYGTATRRPHYHALLFGHRFGDELYSKQSGSGEPIYTSRELDTIWGHGHCWTGTVTFESAAYVARYVMKKVTGEQAEDHYEGRKPEYTTMSRRPGIGALYYQKYKEEVYPRDEIVINGKLVKPPKFYDKLHEQENEEKVHTKVISKRKQLARKNADNNTPDRLRVRETIKTKKLEKLKRQL